VLENMFVRKVFRPKRDDVAEEYGKQHNDEVYKLYSWPNIGRVIKSRIMRRAGHVALKRLRRGECRA
jgi:hypothetical protein